MAFGLRRTAIAWKRCKPEGKSGYDGGSREAPLLLLNGAANVRFGSEADIEAHVRHVRFTPESGHFQRRIRCPLSAKSGHGLRSHRMDGVLGRSYANAAASMEAHQPDSLS